MKFLNASSISHVSVKNGKQCDLFNMTLRLYERSRGGQKYYLQGIYHKDEKTLERFVSKLRPRQELPELLLTKFIAEKPVLQ